MTDPESDEGDLVEQRLSAEFENVDDPEDTAGKTPVDDPSLEADEGDLLEQAEPVADGDDYPYDPPDSSQE
jgi:hypothetical protein